MHLTLASFVLSVGMLPIPSGSAAAATCPSVDPGTHLVTPSPAPGVDWSGCDLSNANLTGADLSNANLGGTNLYNSLATNANLRNAILSNANLDNAWPNYADLSNADLSGANLQHANLQHTNLAHANLSGADLGNAYLGYAWTESVSWANTVCPDSTNSDGHLNGACSPSLSIAGPRKVSAGSRVKITGVLLDDGATCRANQQVGLEKGSAVLGTTTTNDIGAYKFVVRIKKKTTVQVVYKGTALCAGNASLNKTIKVS